MIDAKPAVQIAKEAAEMLNQSPINLEELERETYKDRDVWSITLGFPGQRDPLRITGPPLDYKRFLIDSETGELVAMQIPEVASQCMRSNLRPRRPAVAA